MAFKVGMVVAAFGFMLFMLGIAFWNSTLDLRNTCMSETYRSNHWDDCETASWYTMLGIELAVLGLIILSIGVSIALAWNPRPAIKHFNCPHCGLYIYYETSTYSCIYCGLPVDWSGAKDHRTRHQI
jgi:hypothetical protein